MPKIKNFFPVLSVFLLIGAVLILVSSVSSFLTLEVEGKYGTRYFLSDGSFDYKERKAIFLNKEILAPSTPLSEISENESSSVLGEVSPEEKWIEVDLSEQKLIAWEGDKRVFESLISSGKWAKTPTGEFKIWGKFRYTKMSGGDRQLGTYYYLPNVPFVMYFYKGFGLHGTYWHNNFGEPMSHGCINLPTLVAEKLFYWTTPVVPTGKNSVLSTSKDPGTRVIIHE